MISTNPIPRYAFACLVIVQGCAGLHGGAGAARSAPAGECAQEAALPKKLLEPGSVLLFGETHGTEERPRFFGEDVCTTAASGLAVDVGIEIPRGELASVDAFLASPGGAPDVRA